MHISIKSFMAEVSTFYLLFSLICFIFFCTSTDVRRLCILNFVFWLLGEKQSSVSSLVFCGLRNFKRCYFCYYSCCSSNYFLAFKDLFYFWDLYGSKWFWGLKLTWSFLRMTLGNFYGIISLTIFLFLVQLDYAILFC